MNSLRFLALWALFLAINMAQAYANWINDIGAEVEKSGNEVDDMGKDLDKIFAQDFFSQN
ncbi:uncharacterized protein Dmoj_GI26004 [Drosophila mojavensis]|uniref:Uncharacterized protein n=1 Tax=Drosophila mojavensis TaxID=7230 RepID=A0A0Q9XGP6_DROMO|nr:uncharacterized protein Dmoj_GI26004 [Drosophila mojavensis]